MTSFRRRGVPYSGWTSHSKERNRMGLTADTTPAAKPGPFDRLLGVFTEVHPGEGARAVTMLVTIFVILVSYYILKTVREPLILTTDVPEWLKALGIAGPAEVKTYAAAGQALVLMAFVPAYSAFASRVDRMRAGLRRHGVLRGEHRALRAGGARGRRSHRRLLSTSGSACSACRSSRSSGRTRTTSTPRTPATASFPSSPSA